MSKKEEILKKQLEASEKKSAALRTKIEGLKKVSQPKTIFDRVKNFNDVLKIAKPTKQELTIINYKGRSKRLLFLKYTSICALITEVLNEGKTNNIWFPVFDTTGSGFVFSVSVSNYNFVFTSVGAGLRFCTEQHSDYAGKTFTEEYKNLLVAKLNIS